MTKRKLAALTAIGGMTCALPASVPAAGEVGVVTAAPLIVPNGVYLFDGLRSLARERQAVVAAEAGDE